MNKQENIIIPLVGVNSEHCAQIVSKGLSDVADLSYHQVDVNNQRLIIQAKRYPEELVQAIVGRIRSLGYDVASTTQSFPLLNMSCASCAASSEATINNLTGVIKAEVNYANTSARIEYLPNLINAEQMKTALQEAGYDLLIENLDESKEKLSSIKATAYRQLYKRVLLSLIFAVPLFVIGMFYMNMPGANYWMWTLSTPMLFVFGRQFFIGAWKQAQHRSANMDTLVAISTGTAYAYSVLITLFPNTTHALGIAHHVYFEAAGLVIAFILLGKLLEEKAKGNTSSAIKKLMGLQPKTVTKIHENGQQEEVNISAISRGDTLLVKPGERIAVDGSVSAGSSYVDESMISGEPIPLSKTIGDKVFSGTINQKGSFQFVAEKVGAETLLAHIIKTVEEAQGSKAPVQKLVDKVSAVFVPTVMGIAALSLILWTIFGGENGFSQGLVAFVTVLVIACPCALGLATPTAIMVGVGKGAENGILIKDAESLERANQINAIILDKTGTITEGKPSVSQLKWFKEQSQLFTDILYTIEKSSEHPLADAISQFLAKSANFLSDITVENHTGKGISGKSPTQQYYIGNLSFLKEKEIKITDSVLQWAQQEWDKAQTVVFFADEQDVISALSIADQIKAGSQKAVAALQKLGVVVYMLTGDNEHTAAKVAEETGIKHFKANCLPTDKADFVRKLQAEGKTVTMVGDGINDSQALALADISIAMGKGSDIALEVAKMAIISSDLTKIPEAIALSHSTVKTIKQNLFWAFIYNVIGIPIAAGLLYPINGFMLDPMFAGAAMAFSSVSVVSNSLRLKLKKTF